MMLGVGAIIGTGIFVLTGQAAAANAGPAIVISMVVAGLASALAALCYSEFAASVPVAGSAYTYAYATLGEFVAWVIGWDLILEYALGAAILIQIVVDECYAHSRLERPSTPEYRGNGAEKDPEIE